MKYKSLLFIVLMVKALGLRSQNIQLKLTDSANHNIELVYITLYCQKSNDKITSYHIIRNSRFTIPAMNKCSGFRIEIKAPGYQDYIREIVVSPESKDTLVCVLSSINVKELQPVIVTAQSKPIQVKNDTTTYKVKAFSNGSEQKLSDLLEKLPGIDVNKKTGEIKFKGKPIETILLEGDNLFGTNYTLGSKNINAHLVTEVQAIENYSENYVLKGLEKEEKIVLNIKLVKTKLKVSGNSETGLGIKEGEAPIASDLNSNLLGVGQIHKFFATASYNNTGQNRSPVDYFGNNNSLEQIRDRKYAGKRFIYDPSFVLSESKNYSNINSQLFANYNGLFKLSPEITLKGNFYLIKDKISSRQSFDNEYLLANTIIKTSDRLTGQKKPLSVKSDIHFRYAISSKALLEASFSNTTEEIKSYRTSVSNLVPLYQTNLHTNDQFSKLLVTYTQRMNKRQALQVELQKTQSGIGQAYEVSPSVFKRNQFLNDIQKSHFERNYTQLGATLFGVIKKARYSLFLKGNLDGNYYRSEINYTDTYSTIVSNINLIRYVKYAISQGGTLHVDWGKLKLQASCSLTGLHQEWANQNALSNQSENTVFPEPSIRLKYLLTKISGISLQYSNTRTNTNDQYLFSELIIQNFRNVTLNHPSLSLINTHNITLHYSRSDLFNQFDQGGGVAFQTNNRDYLPTYNVTDTLLYTTFSMVKAGNQMLDIYAFVTKYIPQIRSSVKFSISNTTSYYKNFLWSGLLRNNTNNLTTATLFFKTVFKGAFNFETENRFIINNSKTASAPLISNLSNISNTKLILTPGKKIKMFFVADYYLTNVKAGRGTLFLNYNLSLRPAKGNTELRLVANNITNTLHFFLYQVSDFSKSSVSTNTLPRNILLYVSFRF